MGAGTHAALGHDITRREGPKVVARATDDAFYWERCKDYECVMIWTGAD